MNITRGLIENLQSALSGDTPSIEYATTEEGKFHVGAIWHGDWRNNCEGGASFGSDHRPQHYAGISIRYKGSPFHALAPITSIKNDKAVWLPRGTLDSCRLTDSYLLYRIRLRCSKQRLERDFEYKGQLSQAIVKEMKTRIHHGHQKPN